MRKTLIAFAVIAATGCAAPKPASPPAVVDTTPPVCNGRGQCEAMWVHAQRGVEIAAGMRVQHVTEGRIVTYPAVSYGQMGGEVVRLPVGPNSYEFRVSFMCYRGRDYCNEAKPSATNFFNLYVANRAPR